MSAAVRLCGCGCGEAVVRRYRPGHDARHKAALVAATRNATGAWTREQAVAALDAAGWIGYADLDVLRATPVRNHRRQIRIHVLDAERWIVGPDGTHHARHGCTHLTASARRIGMVHPITRLARPSCVTYVDNTAEVMTRLMSSFDLCGECAIDWTMDEAIEATEMRKQEFLLAMDCEGITSHRQRRPARRVTLAEWTAPIPTIRPMIAWSAPTGPAVALPAPI